MQAGVAACNHLPMVSVQRTSDEEGGRMRPVVLESAREVPLAALVY
jgi:hypothetical protein